MSLVTLGKRLSRVQKDAAHILTPEKPKTSVLQRGINEDATEADQKRFAAEMKNAEARYDLVIVLRPRQAQAPYPAPWRRIREQPA